jgi:3-methyladenine DNA glycosylase AlkD
MPSKPESTPAKPKSKGAKASLNKEVEAVVASLKQSGKKSVRDGMARYAIPADKAFGVSVGDLKKLSTRLRGPDAGRNHELAAGLWASGWYEARMLACFVDEPACVTPAQMDRWCRDFDNWAVCDHSCFHLFDRTPHAWAKVKAWSGRSGEFAKRAAFALLWGLTVHDKQAGDEPFADGLVLIERAATDERNFVKKAVNMALRAIGKRSAALHTAAVAVAQRLAESSDAAPRWVGKDALRELTGPSVTRRLAARRKPALPTSETGPSVRQSISRARRNRPAAASTGRAAGGPRP